MLRAFAVLLVFIFHVFEMIRAKHAVIDDGVARFGVILFFVHTSCVLMGSMQSLRSDGDAWAQRFYLRRLFRLYPLSVFVILVSVLTKAPMMPWMGLEHAPYSASVILSNLLLIQNITGKISVIGVLWSLPIEVEMYLVLPLVFLLVQSRNWGRKMTLLWAGSAVLIVGGQFIAGLVFRGSHKFEALEFIPCFLSGAIAFGLARPARQWPALLWVPSLLVLIAIGGSWAFNPLVFWPCCLALAFLYSRVAQMSRNWFTAICFQIAKYSYGIYLTHSFGLWIFYQLLGQTLHSEAIRLVGTIAFTLVASVFLFHFVEDPMIQLGKRLTTGWAISQGAREPAVQ